MKTTIFRKNPLVLSLLAAFALCAGTVAHAQSFTAGNCLSAGGFCDASNTCVRYAPDDDDVLQEFVLGSCETQGVIIIGPGNASTPIPQGPHVEFVNNTRSGDLVVAAKDTQRGLPGGTKKLQVTVMPPNKMAELTISRMAGNAGSAAFDKNGAQTITVKDGQMITIFGGVTSDMPRNMSITSMIDNMTVPGQFDFTVFRVDASGLISGSLTSVLPRRVLANSGKKLTIGSVPLKPRTMRRLYQDVVTESGGVVSSARPDGKRDERGTPKMADFDRVGHRHINEVVAYGGIVLKGKIMPENIMHTDFSRKLLPKATAANRESFNWLRVKTTREDIFDQAGKLKKSNLCANKAGDDSTDEDEDLIPEDGFVWTIDEPQVIAQPSTKGRGDTIDGDVVRGTYVFADWVEYGGVRVSSDVNWNWLYSHTDPVGPTAFVQENTFGIKDNKMGLTSIKINPLTCTVPAR